MLLVREPAPAAGLSYGLEQRRLVLYRILRRAVRGTIQHFMRANFDAHGGQYWSALSGPVPRTTPVHADHLGAGFTVLADEWIERHGGVAGIEIEWTGRGGPAEIADSSLREQWVAHHAQHAQLRLLTAQENIETKAAAEAA